MGWKVDDILDDNWSLLPMRKDDSMPLELVNKVGTPCGAFPTFMIYPGSYAYQAQRPNLVWDAKICIYEEPNVYERERAMGFFTQSMASHDMFES